MLHVFIFGCTHCWGGGEERRREGYSIPSRFPYKFIPPLSVLKIEIWSEVNNLDTSRGTYLVGELTWYVTRADCSFYHFYPKVSLTCKLNVKTIHSRCVKNDFLLIESVQLYVAPSLLQNKTVTQALGYSSDAGCTVTVTISVLSVVFLMGNHGKWGCKPQVKYIFVMCKIWASPGVIVSCLGYSALKKYVICFHCTTSLIVAEVTKIL